MTNTDAIKVCRHVVSSVSEICDQINFVASESVSDACGKKPTLDGPYGFGKNQLNFANAYANRVLNGNYTADYNVTNACQALGCLDSAKKWLEIK
jgi:aromatic ring-opening dioxygenase LigB subunit